MSPSVWNILDIKSGINEIKFLIKNPKVKYRNIIPSITK